MIYLVRNLLKEIFCFKVKEIASHSMILCRLTMTVVEIEVDEAQVDGKHDGCDEE